MFNYLYTDGIFPSVVHKIYSLACVPATYNGENSISILLQTQTHHVRFNRKLIKCRLFLDCGKILWKIKLICKI